MSFRNSVHRVVASIPSGRVMSYSMVARLAGSPGAARVVGSLMARNSIPGTGPGRVPCHRVVRSDGSLGGFTSPDGPPAKRVLLKKEGVAFTGDKISNESFYPGIC